MNKDNVVLMDKPTDEIFLSRGQACFEMPKYVLSLAINNRTFAPLPDITPLEAVWINAMFATLCVPRLVDCSTVLDELERQCPGASRHFAKD